MKSYSSILIGIFLSLSLPACDKIAEEATESIIEKAIESETGNKVAIGTSDDP